MTDYRDNNEIYRLEAQLDQLTRTVDQLKDIQLAAQRLIDATNLQRDNRFTNSDDLVQKRYEQLCLSLRAYYQPNGEER
jgi:hypothetical protein